MPFRHKPAQIALRVPRLEPNYRSLYLRELGKTSVQRNSIFKQLQYLSSIEHSYRIIVMARRPSKVDLLLKDVPPPLRNKFILVTGLFVVWMFFFDNNSVISQFKLQSTRNELEEKLEYHQKEIAKSEQDNRELLTDDKSREKFAREHYYMKKTDEELFIIED